MKQRLFVETTIPSYLVARPSRDLIVAACQRVTREWWDSRRGSFDLYVSRLVLEEAGAGDPEPASQRLGLLRGIAILDVDDGAVGLAERLMTRPSLPPKARLDSLHIAVSAVNGWSTCSPGIASISRTPRSRIS